MEPRAVVVREERSDDGTAIREIVTAAFGGAAEATLVDALRDAGDTVIALVAEEHGRVVGHLALSKMAAPFAALALAPVSVLPERQRDGIGSALIREAISRARPDWTAIFVLGDPRFYGRFGFDVALATDFASPYAGPHFMALALTGTLPTSSGILRHAPAFAALS
jgi:putative acetyltransferase